MRIAITQTNIHVVLCQYRDWPMPVPFIFGRKRRHPIMVWPPAMGGVVLPGKVVVALLKEKQEKFCTEYLACGNATQAAIRAGYRARNARQIGAENLTKLVIQKRIQELREKAASSKVLTYREKREWIADRMRDPEERSDIKAKLLDLDNKMEGVYVNRTELSGAGGGAIEFVWAGDDSEG